MRGVLITNNKLVQQAYSGGYASVLADDDLRKAGGYTVVFVEGGLTDVLLAVRGFIHKGHELLTHPLSGSVKPNENPFKSILVSTNAAKDGQADVDSVRVIENAILTAQKFGDKYQSLSDKMLSDFETVDYSLIKSALG